MVLKIYNAQFAEEIAHIRDLFTEYAASLEVDLCFQGFAQELAGLPGDYARPEGRLLIAEYNRQVAGCVALRKIDEDIAEMKRLYLRPSFRGKGIGRKLAERVIQEAQHIGYTRLRLDTLPTMQEAIVLYRTLGFQEIAPYRHNPIEGALHLERVLQHHVSASI
jgi:putative acetyltransferase